MSLVPTVDTVATPQAFGFDAELGSLLLRLAASPEYALAESTPSAQPQRIDTAASAEDMLDEFGLRYSLSDMSGGAGLQVLHQRSAPKNADKRFYASRGVDVFRTNEQERYGVTLQHEVTLVRTNTPAAFSGVVRIGDYAYTCDGAAVATASGGTSIASFSSTPSAFVAMHDNFYGLLAASIEEMTLGGVTSNYVTGTFDNLWAAKGRLIATQSNQLHEVTNGTTVVRHTIDNDETFVDVADVGPAVLAASTDGSIYSYQLDSSDNLGLISQYSFIGEVPVKLEGTQGVVGIVTKAVNESAGSIIRFYRAAVTPDGALTDMQLVYRFGDSDSQEIYNIEATASTRDSIFVAISGLDGDVPTGTNDYHTHLVQYYLPEDGWARSLEIPLASNNSLTDMVALGDRFWFTTYQGEVWKEADTYVSEGYIIGPLADFFTAAEKQWVAGRIDGLTDISGTQIDLLDGLSPPMQLDPDSSDWQLIANARNGQTVVEEYLAARNSRWHVGKVVLRSDSSRTYTPTLYAASFRAMPNPERDFIVVLPVNVSDWIETPGRRRMRVPGRGAALMDALRAYRGVHTTVKVYRTNLSLFGLVDVAQATVEMLPNRGAPTDVLMLQVRGKISQTSGTPTQSTSGAALGEDLLGTALLGQGIPN